MTTDELVEELARSHREALEDGVRHGIGLAIAVVNLSASMDETPTLEQIVQKLRHISAAFAL